MFYPFTPCPSLFLLSICSASAWCGLIATLALVANKIASRFVWTRWTSRFMMTTTTTTTTMRGEGESEGEARRWETTLMQQRARRTRLERRRTNESTHVRTDRWP
ncbi:hypothetical protein BKA80DRAFT_266309 [Phyllosticta citrichinensis]